jgi:hypothetical protein
MRLLLYLVWLSEVPSSRLLVKVGARAHFRSCSRMTLKHTPIILGLIHCHCLVTRDGSYPVLPHLCVSMFEKRFRDFDPLFGMGSF